MDDMVKKIPAIIPARGGSKGLPRKNILDLCGKPLIAWTIDAAMGSDYISDVIVSTDDEKIAEISQKYGAQIPFMRPDYLATDSSIAIDTYLYTIEKLNELNNNAIEDFVVLQPTSPLRKSKHINEAIELFYKKIADSVISIYEAKHPPFWYKTIDEDNRITNLFDELKYTINRQQLPKSYIPNGAILVLKYDLLLKSRSYYSKNSIAYIMDQLESIDIDDTLDFYLCEKLLMKK